MKYTCLFALFALLAACSSQPPLPAACELLMVEQLEEIMREPVEDPQGVAANRGELSACDYTLPGRSLEESLTIYLFPPAASEDAAALHQLADEWKEYCAGDDYSDVSKPPYPMAWFPGKPKVYPSTFIILFERVTVVVTGALLDDAKSIAFRAMVQYEWE